MDAGWALILGAVIALTGSSLLPWWRESRATRLERINIDAQRRADAIVELLARNSGLAMSAALQDSGRVQAAYEARQRAMIRLILEVDEDQRDHLSSLLSNSVPIVTRKDKQATPGQMASALQNVVLDWASGTRASKDLYSRYLKLTKPPEAASSDERSR